MRLVPESNAEKIEFFKLRAGPWAAHAAEIGTTAEEVAALDADVADAHAARAAQHAAQRAAVAATMRLNEAVERMARRGASIVQQIRAKAGLSGDPSVYVTALIPPPAHASALPPPGTPHAFTVELQQVGWLTLRWKCKNPRGAAGTMYHVERSVDGEPVRFLAVTGERSFVDAAVPAGTREIVYRVRGVRSTAVGEAAEHLVHLNGDSMRGISPIQPSSSRKAALIAA